MFISSVLCRSFGWIGGICDSKHTAGAWHSQVQSSKLTPHSKHTFANTQTSSQHFDRNFLLSFCKTNKWQMAKIQKNSIFLRNSQRIFCLSVFLSPYGVWECSMKIIISLETFDCNLMYLFSFLRWLTWWNWFGWHKLSKLTTRARSNHFCCARQITGNKMIGIERTKTTKKML